MHLDTGGNNCYGYPYNKRFTYANWWYCFNKNDIQPPQARWYGKVGTILFYISVCTIVVLKVFGIEVPYLSVILLSVTAATMIFALVKYFLLFLDLITNGSNQKKGE